MLECLTKQSKGLFLFPLNIWLPHGLTNMQGSYRRSVFLYCVTCSCRRQDYFTFQQQITRPPATRLSRLPHAVWPTNNFTYISNQTGESMPHPSSHVDLASITVTRQSLRKGTSAFKFRLYWLFSGCLESLCWFMDLTKETQILMPSSVIGQ